MELFGVYYTSLDIGGVGDGSLTVKKTDIRPTRTVYPFRTFQIISTSFCHLIVTVTAFLIAFAVSHLPSTLAAIATLYVLPGVRYLGVA